MKRIQNKMMTILVALTVTWVATAQASLVLVHDEFSSDSVKQVSYRYYDEYVNNGKWIKRDSNWSVVDGVLTNPALSATDDRGAHLINSVTTSDTSLTRVKVSFDYTVGEGSTLYLYTSLFTGALQTSLQARITQQGGNTYLTDFNETTTWGGFPGPEYNLKNGNSPGNTTPNALASFVGPTSGTFTQTYDISGFGGGGFSLTNVTHILCVFTVNSAAEGEGAITIDNFDVRTPPQGTMVQFF